ncbi:hypothetical protein D3C72_1202720 [compost metagenome]
MLRAAHIDGADIELARPRLGLGDQILQRTDRAVLRHQHGEIKIAQRGDRCKILGRVVRKRLEQPLCNCVGIRHEQQREAIGRGPHHLLGSHHAARARLVVHDDGLAAEQLGHFLRHDAHGEIGYASRAEGHHDADGLGRK